MGPASSNEREQSGPAARPEGSFLRTLTRRCWFRAIGTVALLVLLLLLLHRPILRAAGDALVVTDEPAQADLIFLLNGALEVRPEHAANLYRAGYASQVWIAEAEGDLLVELGLRRGWTELSVLTMTALGIPPSAIRVLPFPGGTTSTQDEAIALARGLAAQPARRILVVTSDYHTRRTRWTIRREIEDADVELLMAAPPDDDEGDWWTRESTFLVRLEEYLKLLHTWLRG